MQTIDLAVVPNQTFSTTLDNNRYDFAIYLANGLMCCDITLNEIRLVSGQRITDGSFLIPYFALTGQTGNFMLLTQDSALPDFNEFATTQTLIYLSFAEIQAAVASK